MVGESDVLDEVADEIATLAKAEAGKHARTHAFQRSIHVVKDPGKKGVTDRLVVADDPAASYIEMGHLAPNGTWVPGQHILRNASKQVDG
jgi:hypothetical protein